MNQLEQNRIAEFFIHNQSIDVTKKLESVLTEDLKEKGKEVPGSAIHYIHNIALFYALLRINCLFQAKTSSEAATRQYLEHAETLRPKFLDIVDSIKDFRPTSEKDKNDNTTDE